MTQQIDPMHRIAMMAGDIHSIATENESAWQHDGIDTVLEYAKKIESLALAAAPAADGVWVSREDLEMAVDVLSDPNECRSTWHFTDRLRAALAGGPADGEGR